jgi:prophage antirepressor-like protein
MNNIQVFQNEQFGQIRTAVTETGEPLFCLSDICKVLELSNPSVVAQRLDEEERPKLDLGLKNGQLAYFITEPGMYTVVLRSDSPKAKPMQKWVTSEVLPALRKTGGYMVARQDETPEQLMARALKVAEDTIKRIAAEKQFLEERDRLQRYQLKQAAPMVTYYKHVLLSNDTYTTTQIAKELGMGAPTLNEKLRKMGVQYKQNGQWILMYKHQHKGYTKTHTHTFTHKDGQHGTSIQTVWTETGRQFIHELLQPL